MSHNTFKVAELILDKLMVRLGRPKMIRQEKRAMIEQALKQGGSISCTSDGKQIELEYHSSTLAMCVYMMMLADGIAEELPNVKGFEILKILADVGEILERGH